MVPPRYPTLVESTPGICLYAASTPQKQPAPKVASFSVSSVSFFSILSPLIHVVREQMMKVVCSNFAPRRKPPAIVQPRAHSALYGLDHFFVFHLDLVQVAAHAFFPERFLPYIRYERDAGSAGAEWIDHVQR